MRKNWITRESSFEEGEDIEEGAPKIFRHPKGGSKKIGGGGPPKICILQNQQEGGAS